MAWWNIFSPIVDAVGGWAQASEETKQIKAKSKVDLAKAQSDLKIARVNSDTAIEIARGKAAGKLEDHVQDYDMQVLKNRQRSVLDEFIVVGLMLLLLAHFLPFTQSYMRPGWAAMGYKDGPAWWFEFSIVVAIVSTLGGMRVLKEFFGGALSKVRSAKKG